MDNCHDYGYCPTGPVCNNHIITTGNRHLGFWEPTKAIFWILRVMFSVTMFHEHLRGHKNQPVSNEHTPWLQVPKATGYQLKSTIFKIVESLAAGPHCPSAFMGIKVKII